MDFLWLYLYKGMFKQRLSGIYMIKNINTEEYYIGMSVDIFSRWANHYNDIKINKHSSPKLIELWNNSKPTDWQFIILEVISKTQHKIDTGLKGKAFDASFRKLLLKKEKEHMKQFSVTYALNKNNKWFS